MKYNYRIKSNNNIININSNIPSSLVADLCCAFFIDIFKSKKVSIINLQYGNIEKELFTRLKS